MANTLVSIQLDGIAQYAQSVDNYEFNIYVRLTDRVDIPKSVRKTFEQRKQTQLMFVVASYLDSDPHYDWETEQFTFFATFGGIPHTVVVPADAFIGVSSAGGHMMWTPHKQTDTTDETSDSSPAETEKPNAAPKQRSQHLRVVK